MDLNNRPSPDERGKIKDHQTCQLRIKIINTLPAECEYY